MSGRGASGVIEALEHHGSGKVREMYRLDDDRLVMVATDRISAYDVVLPDPIPDKGRVLTGLSLHWLSALDLESHLVSSRPEDAVPLEPEERRRLAGRTMVVRRAEVIPVECVVRGHLYGSSWKEYREGGGPTTEHLPAGLREADRLSEPIFTPATKATDGHDQNLSEAEARRALGDDLFEELRSRTVDIYLRASELAMERGIVLADTKLEFGFVDGRVLLIDEVLTPDSSRYWPADEWRPGGSVPSFDKQYVRDWLDAAGWDRRPPAPRLPDEVVEGTRSRYVEAYERLTGEGFDRYLERAGAT